MTERSLRNAVAAIVVSAFLISQAWADCPLAHTHIGINPTLRPDWSDPGTSAGDLDCWSGDDNQLWMFSTPPVHAVAPTPGWPQWGEDPVQPGAPFLKLVPELDEFGDPIPKPTDPAKFLYTCRFKWSADLGYGDPDGVQHLDGWHSAHGPRGMWGLESVDEETEPSWDVGIRRVSTSLADQTDFLMIKQDDTGVLTADGDTYKFTAANGEKLWLEDKNAWGIHSHMGFFFYLPDTMLGETVWCDFTAFDDSGMYTEGGSSLVGRDGVEGEHPELGGSDTPFRFNFEVTPEPGTAGLLLVGALAVLRRCR